MSCFLHRYWHLHLWMFTLSHVSFSGDSVVKNPSANAGDTGDVSSVPELGRSLGGGNGNQLQCSCLENSMDRGPWWATFHVVAQRWTQPSTHTHTSSNTWWDKACPCPGSLQYFLEGMFPFYLFVHILDPVTLMAYKRQGEGVSEGLMESGCFL